MKKPIFLIFFLHLTTSLLCSAAHLPIIASHGAPRDRHQAYIIHVLKPNDTDYLSDDHRLRHHLSFLPTTLLDSGEPRLIYSYSHAISGFAARLTPDELQSIQTKPGFLFAIPDQAKVKPHTTYTPSFIGLNSNSGAWPDSSFGEGIIIGLIDTGVDPSHASFADDGTMPPPPPKWRGRCDFLAGVCNNKLIGAVAFEEGTHPSPLDDLGHGTHTASTAAGTAVRNASVLGQAAGVATGVAPRAHLAVYKVLFDGSGTFSDIVAGIDRAIADGVDVLSMSLGTDPSELYDNSLITSSFAAMQHNVFPSTSAGNSGPFQSYITNDAPWMLTVAAGTTDRRIKATLLLGNNKTFDGETAYQPNIATIPFTSIVYPSDCSPSTLAKTGVTGKIVVCYHSDVIVTGSNVKDAGGAAMVLQGPAERGLSTFSDPNVLPAVSLNYPDSDAVIDYIWASTSTAVASLEFRGTQFGAPNSPSVASFSSRGPSDYNGGILKPDVMAPGVNVLAAWPKSVGPDQKSNPPNKNFNFLSGTSMAAPHLSGVAAIIKKLHPDWSTAAVKSAIMTTAYATYPDGSAIADQYPDNPAPPAAFFAIGAGQVDASKAAEPGLVYDAGVDDYVGYMCGLGYSDAQVSAVVQSSVKCAAVKSIPAEQLNYPSISLTYEAGRKKKSVRRTVTNVGEAKSIYKVKYVAPAGLKLTITPPVLEFSKVGEKKSFAVGFRTGDGASPKSGEVAQGELSWVKDKVTVRSPIVITFA
ncbi:Subtilisin-like protease SDD1 [Dendrobium catenatum]|uniref:Subtilisin-like protease SDD1 n=2 Tax=Dendrobium catenatum TaxID=906689 RepID=A0A2I0X013_9ASPA|nr:Subtilisin-like protease SDD1 [Dendrobium catenatum]